MHKNINYIYLFIFIITACSATGSYNKDATITGTIEGSNNEKLTLERLGGSEVQFIDTTRVNEKGQFSFDVKVMEPGFYKISLAPKNFLTLILDSTETVQINTSIKNFAIDYEVSGSAQSTRLLKLNRELHRFYTYSDSLGKVGTSYRQTGNAQGLQQLQAQFEIENSKHQQWIKSFVDQDPGSIVALATVQKLDPESDIDYFKKIAEGLQKKHPNLDYTSSFVSQVSQMSVINVGQQAPDFTLTSPEGKQISLSDYKGKVVLIDFWASWCRPCRMENPNVVRMYNQYKDKGFDILGVSLDNSKDRWVGAIAQDGLTWEHVSDLKGWKSMVVPLYKVKGIPYTILVNQEGVIIGKKLRGAGLEQKLQEVLGS